MELKFDEDLKPVILTDDEPKTAKMEQRALLGGLDQFKFGNIEIGTALVGGTVATLMSETVDGLIPNGNNLLGAVAKLGVASFVLPIFKGIVGAKGVNQAQTFVAYDVVRTILPLDNLIRQATSVFGGRQLQYAPSKTTEYGGAAGAMFGENGSLANWASVVGGGS